MGTFILVTVYVLASFSSQINADNNLNRVPKISGGITPVPQNEIYQVAIRKNNGRICTGALINSHWVLTSAVCAQSRNQLMVLAGLQSTADWTTAIRATPFPHPHFNPNTLRNDLALLKLTDPASVVGTTLLAPPITFIRYYYGLKAIVSGWGSLADTQTHNPDLSYKVVDIVKNSNCINMDYPATDGYKICTYGRAICEGDQGAPLVMDDTLIGVASAASDALLCQGHKSAQFTNINFYMGWINSIMSKY